MSEETNVLTRFGAPYRLTEKGIHYYKDLISKYMQGLKLNDDKLIILFGMGIYACKLTDVDVDIEYQIMWEIRDKLGINMLDFDHNNEIKSYMYERKLLEDNPDYDSDFSNKILEAIESGRL